MKQALQGVQPALRLLLGMGRPAKYDKQKRRKWQEDLRLLFTLREAALQAHIVGWQAAVAPVVQEKSPTASAGSAASGSGNEEDVDDMTLEDLAAAMAA